MSDIGVINLAHVSVVDVGTCSLSWARCFASVVPHMSGPVKTAFCVALERDLRCLAWWGTIIATSERCMGAESEGDTGSYYCF